MAYRQARRRENDTAVVNAAFLVELTKRDLTGIPAVHRAQFLFGGRGPLVKAARGAQQSIIGLSWDNALLEKMLHLLPLDLCTSSDASGGMTEYRQALSLSLFYKFYMTVLGRITASVSDII